MSTAEKFVQAFEDIILDAYLGNDFEQVYVWARQHRDLVEEHTGIDINEYVDAGDCLFIAGPCFVAYHKLTENLKIPNVIKTYISKTEDNMTKKRKIE